MRPRGKWSDPEVPHIGWTCVGFEDLGGLHETCGMCEKQEIRYVHHMSHPNYPDTIGAGCECAASMEAEYQAAHARESRHKNRASRRTRWLTRQWRESAKGHPYLNTDGFNVVVFRSGQGWGFRVKERLDDALYLLAAFTGAQQQSPRQSASLRRYATADAAKLAAFDALMFLKDR